MTPTHWCVTDRSPAYWGWFGRQFGIPAAGRKFHVASPIASRLGWVEASGGLHGNKNSPSKLKEIGVVMKCALLTAVVVLSVFGLVASASAGQKHRNRDENNSNSEKYRQNSNSNSQSKLNFIQKFNKSQTQNSQNIRPSWKANGDSFGTSNGNAEHKKHGKKHQQQMQLDPGRPDGRVQVPDIATPQLPLPPSRPGYVFVNGHWERAKVGSATTGNPINASVEVRDHRAVEPTGTSGRGGRPGHGGYFPSTPKDSSTSSGGVMVTDSPPRDLTGQTVYGEGPGLHSLWDFVHMDFPELRLTTTDHRDVKVPYATSTLPPPPSVRPAGK